MLEERQKETKHMTSNPRKPQNKIQLCAIPGLKKKRENKGSSLIIDVL